MCAGRPSVRLAADKLKPGRLDRCGDAPETLPFRHGIVALRSNGLQHAEETWKGMRWLMGIVARSAFGGVLGLLLLHSLFSSPSEMKVSAQTTPRTTVNFDVVAFDLPGPGWQRSTATPRQIGYTRKIGDGKSQSIG